MTCHTPSPCNVHLPLNAFNATKTNSTMNTNLAQVSQNLPLFTFVQTYLALGPMSMGVMQCVEIGCSFMIDDSLFNNKSHL